jgi:hypothetical protein
VFQVDDSVQTPFCSDYVIYLRPKYVILCCYACKQIIMEKVVRVSLVSGHLNSRVFFLYVIKEWLVINSITQS